MTNGLLELALVHGMTRKVSCLAVCSRYFRIGVARFGYDVYYLSELCYLQ